MHTHKTRDGLITVIHNSDWSGEVYVVAVAQTDGEITRQAILPGSAVLSGDYECPGGCLLTERELRRATALAMCVHVTNAAIEIVEDIPGSLLETRDAISAIEQIDGVL